MDNNDLYYCSPKNAAQGQGPQLQCVRFMQMWNRDVSAILCFQTVKNPNFRKQNTNRSRDMESAGKQ